MSTCWCESFEFSFNTPWKPYIVLGFNSMLIYASASGQFLGG
jgi:hypothetical protein